MKKDKTSFQNSHGFLMWTLNSKLIALISYLRIEDGSYGLEKEPSNKKLIIIIIQAECFKDSKYTYDYQAGPNIHMRKEERDQKNPITSISEFQIWKNSHVKFNNYVGAWLAQSGGCVTLATGVPGWLSREGVWLLISGLWVQAPCWV